MLYLAMMCKFNNAGARGKHLNIQKDEAFRFSQPHSYHFLISNSPSI